MRAGIGGQDAGPAAIGKDCHSFTFGDRLVGKQNGRIKKFPDGIHHDNTCFAEKGVRNDIGSSHGPGVGTAGREPSGVLPPLIARIGFLVDIRRETRLNISVLSKDSR